MATTPPHGGRATVTWVAPNGPAGLAGVRPGDHVVLTAARGSARTDVVLARGRRIVLRARALAPTMLDLLDTGVGLCLLAVGLLVYRRSADPAVAPFWLLCWLAGLALALAPALTHGMSGLLLLHGVVMRLIGPAIVGVALAVVVEEHNWWRRRWWAGALWLPAAPLAVVYTVRWLGLWAGSAWLPAVLDVTDGTVRTLYLMMAVLLLLRALRLGLSEQRRAHLQWLALGLLGGFFPHALLTLLPWDFMGHPILRAQASLLTLALLPLCVGVAIVRVEFLGIVTPLRRQTLRLLVGVTMVALLASGVALLAVLAWSRWDWSLAAIAVGSSLLSALLVAILGPRLLRTAEQLLLPAVDDAAMVLPELIAELAHAAPHEVGAQVVRRLGTLAQLTDVALLTSRDCWSYRHPRAARPVATSEAVLIQLRRLLDTPPMPDAAPSEDVVVVTSLDQRPVRAWLVRESEQAPVRAVLGLGPTRDGGPSSARDLALVRAIVQLLALRLSVEHAAPHADGLLLSARERQMLLYLTQGRTNKEIAGLLGLNIKTVERHVTHLIAKLGARSRTEAVAIAYRSGFLAD